jgi:hypothetical protein
LYQALLQVDGESFTVQVGLLLIRIDMVRPVLGKGVELPHVVEYTTISLLKIKELLQLGSKQTRRQVMCVESSTELAPWNMVIHW